MICFDAYQAYGAEHCVASLKCGHVFGLSCAQRAIKARKICPTCRLPARMSDIRKIYWRCVSGRDSAILPTLFSNQRTNED